MSVRIIAKSIWGNPGNQGQKLRRTAYAVGWQAWKRSIGKPRILTLFNGRNFIAHPDCVVSSSLIYSRCPEYVELTFVRRVLDRADVIIDIGANVGHVGLLLSDLVAPENIYSFEPTPITFARLCANWSANQFPLAGLNQVALGETEGVVKFPDLAHPGTMNSQVVAEAGSGQTTVEVKLQKLDSYRECWTNKQIGFLKIDVEGHEVDVLRGARQTLQQDRPRLIMFESLESEVVPDVGAELKSANYRLFQLDESGHPLLDVTSNQNVFAVPCETLDEVFSS